MPNGSAPPPMEGPAPTSSVAPPTPRSPTFYVGSSGVVAIKVMAIIVALISIIWYFAFIAYSDSPYHFIGLIIALVALIIGIIGIWMGNIRISKRESVPGLNAILLMISVGLLFVVPVLGSWSDPRSLGEMFNDAIITLTIALYGLLTLSYIELAHATIRFSQIDEYAKSQNIEDFSVNPVISNYFVWFAILMVIIYLFVLGILFLRWGYMPALEESAPQFANSIEMNSVYSVALSIGIIFIPLAAIIAYIFGAGSLIKTTKEVIIKGPETEEYYGMGPIEYKK